MFFRKLIILLLLLLYYIYDTVSDLEISDFVNRTPSLNLRTPGQLLSLTSHLSFGSGGGESIHNSVMSTDACENLLDELKETCMILILSAHYTSYFMQPNHKLYDLSVHNIK